VICGLEIEFRNLLQIEFKVRDITTRLQYLEADILRVHPTYSTLIRQRRLEYGGAICAVDMVKESPAGKRVAFSCSFAVGTCFCL
jgi:hypothetical protein